MSFCSIDFPSAKCLLHSTQVLSSVELQSKAIIFMLRWLLWVYLFWQTRCCVGSWSWIWSCINFFLKASGWAGFCSVSEAVPCHLVIQLLPSMSCMLMLGVNNALLYVLDRYTWQFLLRVVWALRLWHASRSGAGWIHERPSIWSSFVCGSLF